MRYEFRVVWKRRGHPRRQKRFANLATAERRDAGMCYVDDEGAEFIPYGNERPAPNGTGERNG